MNEQQKLQLIKDMLEGRIPYDVAMASLQEGQTSSGVPGVAARDIPLPNPDVQAQVSHRPGRAPGVRAVTLETRPLGPGERLMQAQEEWEARDAQTAVPQGPQAGPYPEDASPSLHSWNAQGRPLTGPSPTYIQRLLAQQAFEEGPARAGAVPPGPQAGPYPQTQAGNYTPPVTGGVPMSVVERNLRPRGRPMPVPPAMDTRDITWDGDPDFVLEPYTGPMADITWDGTNVGQLLNARRQLHPDIAAADVGASMQILRPGPRMDQAPPPPPLLPIQAATPASSVDRLRRLSSMSQGLGMAPVRR